MTTFNTAANGGQILTAELLPCPFCGSQVEFSKFEFGGVPMCEVRCCLANTRRSGSIEMAAQRWNRRASLAAPAIPTVDRNAQEDVAKAIYRLFDGAEAHPWRNGGNSNKQDEARRYARAAISAAQPAAQVAVSEDQRDAARYRWLRERDWFSSPLCVLRDPKRVLTKGIGLGADCPSHSRLDAAIDAALATQATVKTAEVDEK